VGEGKVEVWRSSRAMHLVVLVLCHCDIGRSLYLV